MNQNETAYSGFRWYILFTMVICKAVTAMAMISPAPLTGVIMKTMPNLTAGQVTLMTMSSFNLFVAVSALLGGVLLDKYGVIKVYIGGMILVTVGSLLMPVTGHTVLGVLFNRFLQGMGTGPIMASAPALASAFFPSRERGIVTGFQGFSMAFGIVLGLSIIPRLAVSFGSWEKALMIVGPIGVIGLILTVIIFFGPKPTQAAAQQTKAEEDVRIAHAFKKAVMYPITWVAIACFFCMSWIFQAFNGVVPGYIAVDAAKGLGSLGLGAVKGGDYMILAQIFFMTGSVLGGVITDKVFRGNGRPVMVIGFLLGAVFSFFIKADFITANQAMFIFCLTGCGFFFSFVNPQVMGYIAKNYPKNITGKLGGLATGIGIFGGWGGATVGAAAIDWSGYPLSISIMSGLLVIGFIISLFLRPKKTGE
jgi:MFS family permease